MRLLPGSLVVFEGLDKAGKSTQVDALSGLAWDSPTPLSTHMPSGLVDLTKSVYQLMEEEDTVIHSPLARQLLHLACHSENREAISNARKHRGVFLDRWWWSTVAYGWYGDDLRDVVDEDVFFGMIGAVWGGMDPNVIFLFLEPHEEDALNRDEVAAGYSHLQSTSTDNVVIVPIAGPDETTDWILSFMVSQGLVVRPK